MRKAIILHGTSGNSQENWFPWLKNELEQANWDVWVPDLPDADEPNIKKYNRFIFSNLPWQLDKETILIGHSSGAVAALGLLQSLMPGTVVKKCILVGSFKDDLGWPNLKGLFETPLDFEEIKTHCPHFLFIHSDDDPYCPLDHAQYLSTELGGTLKVIPGQKHFSKETDVSYVTFPLLKETLLHD